MRPRCAQTLGALLAWALAPALVCPAGAAPHRYYKIIVLDAGTGRPVSGVRLETVHHLRFTSDANGVVAFYEPGLMGRAVYFTAEKQGYQMPADGLGLRGQALEVSEGGAGTIRLPRAAGPAGPDVTTTYESALVAGPVPEAAARLRVTVLDEASGRPLPLAELRVADRLWVTDSAGVIALHDPARMGQAVTGSLRSHGYEPQERVDLRLTPGGAATLRLRRRNLAERLYRVTGGAIYGESALLDLPAPTKAPLLAGLVLGQDSVQTTLYKGRVFWIWGDTNRPSYALGNFRATGALSDLPAQGGLDPALGVDLRYFVGADGFAREMAPDRTVPGPGVTWLGGLVSLREGEGEALYATYGKYQGLQALEQGMLRYDDGQGVFVKLRAFQKADVVRPAGHPMLVEHGVQVGDERYVYYQNLVRVPAKGAALADPGTYEAFTARRADGTVDRGPDGLPRYEWRRGAAPLGPDDLKAGLLKREEALFAQARDAESGESVVFHENSDVQWSERRGRYVGIMLQAGGQHPAPSLVGELWYAEGDTPMGPFVHARKIVTHAGYNCYNPRHHPFFDEEEGRRVLFECTYTSLLTDVKDPTPRYDYNQVMYRLDLDDAALALPVPIYDLESDGIAGELVSKDGLRPWQMVARPRVAFLAPDRPAPGTVAVGWSGPSCGPRRLVVGAPAEVAFYAIPAEGPRAGARPQGTIPLYEYVQEGSGVRAYSVDPAWPSPGYRRAEAPLCYVWPSPLAVPLPVLDYLPTLIADAGADLCLREEAAGQGASVALSGSRSLDRGGPIAEHRWRWSDGGPREASGPSPQIRLPVGVHRVDLTVRGADGRERSDSVLVEVAAAGSPDTPPTLEEMGCACQAGRGPGAAPGPAVLALASLLGFTARRRRR